MPSTTRVSSLSIVTAFVLVIAPSFAQAQSLPTPKPSTLAEFHEFGAKLIGNWKSEGVMIDDWPGQTKKAGDAFTGHTSFRWTEGRRGFTEKEKIGQMGVARLYLWNPETRLIESRGVTSQGTIWTTTFWKEGDQWKWVHEETSEDPSQQLVGHGDVDFENDHKHVRKGTLWIDGQKLLPYNDVYRRTSVSLEDFRPKLGRFEGEGKLIADFGGSKRGENVTWIQDRKLSMGGSILEVTNFVVADGKTTLASVELHRFDEKRNTTTLVAASPEGLFQGTWRRKPDETNTLVLDWTWGDTTGTTEITDISDDGHKIQFKNVQSTAGTLAASDGINMRRVDVSAERIAEVQKSVNYFLGEWTASRTVDGKTEQGTMKVERAPDGHGQLVTQHWPSENMTGLFGFDTATGRWTGRWQTQSAGVVGHEVWPDLKPGRIQSGQRFVSRQTSTINGQRGIESWTYEIKSDDRFECNSFDIALAGKPQPEVRMEFKRKLATAH